MKNRDKNKIILVISAVLIVISIAITSVAFVVEKRKTDEANIKASQQALIESMEESHQQEQNAPVTTPQTTAPQQSSNNKPGIYKVVTNTQPLGIRTRPENDASRAGSVAKDSEVEIFATYDGWAYVKDDDNWGWLNMEYLELIEETELPAHTEGKYIVATQNDPLNIREKPKKYATSKDQLPKGTEIEVLTVCEDWGYVEYEGTTGWVPFEYLEAVN